MNTQLARKPLAFKSSRGFYLLLVVGVVAIMSAVVFGLLAVNMVKDKQDRMSFSQDGMNQAKAFVMDYLRQNRKLPDVASFDSGTSRLTDAWNRRFLYFPSNNLLAGDICAQTNTFNRLSQCGGDSACSSPSTALDIPFLILSGGEQVKSSTDPVIQTAPYTASSSISVTTTFKQYISNLVVGPHANPTNPNAQFQYDDMVLSTSLPEIYAAAGCLSDTQGDVQKSGGTLKILNTETTLPPATCGAPYSKTLLAYGRSTGTYTWAITNLPSGLTPSASGVNATISGTPTVGGILNSVTATVTDSAGKTHSRTYDLSVAACPCIWTDTSPLVTQLAACPAGQTGSISQKKQTKICDGTTQWINTSDTCQTPVQATFNGRLAGALPAFNSGDNSSNQTTIVIGSGTNQITIYGYGNDITRHSTGSSNPALGVTGGGSDQIDSGQRMRITFDGGYGSQLGIEFRNLSGSEIAKVDFIDTVSGVTVATYDVAGCTSNSSSSYSLPVVSYPFNQIVVTASNSPSANFYIRGVRTCDALATTCYSNTGGSATTNCPYP